MVTQKIVIVGGGLAASRTAEQLRRAEYAGDYVVKRGARSSDDQVRRDRVDAFANRAPA